MEEMANSGWNKLNPWQVRWPPKNGNADKLGWVSQKSTSATPVKMEPNDRNLLSFDCSTNSTAQFIITPLNPAQLCMHMWLTCHCQWNSNWTCSTLPYHPTNPVVQSAHHPNCTSKESPNRWKQCTSLVNHMFIGLQLLWCKYPLSVES